VLGPVNAVCEDTDKNGDFKVHLQQIPSSTYEELKEGNHMAERKMKTGGHEER
jgi:hypothetical protein